LKEIDGTATATLGVGKVLVAVVQFTNGAHVAQGHPKPSCQQLGRGGKLHTLHVGAHNRCTATRFLVASGTTNWRLKLSRRLPKGHYVAISQAFDTAGHA